MGRQDIIESLNHRRPAKIPVDFGSTAVTGIHVSIVEALRRHYGLEDRPVKVTEPYQMLGEVDTELKEVLGVDTAGVPPRKTMFGFENQGWKEWRTPWGQDVLVPARFEVDPQAGGDILIYPEGDRSASPSGKMPASGFFFDTIVRQEPIDDASLDAAGNLEEFEHLSAEDLSYFGKEAERASLTGRAVVATIGGLGLGDIALVPGPFMKRPKGIRDIEEWYVSTITRKDLVHAIFAHQVEVGLANLEEVKKATGDNIDVMFICGTDFGTQTSTFCSPQTFRELYYPYYKTMNDWIHRNTRWKTFKHCCGAARSLIPDFIEAGFDILNPVQCSATGMSPRELKKEFGDHLVFWGGGVDTQKTLPFGTPAEVRREVLDRLDIFADSGGFVFDAIHNIQARTPVKNVVAMIEAVSEFNR